MMMMMVIQSFSLSFGFLLRLLLLCGGSDGLLPDSVSSQLSPQLSGFGRNLRDTLK